MSILTPRATYAPFEYEQAYKYWELQQQSHWLHCVGPDDRVFTNKGLLRVVDLYHSKENLVVFNGNKWVESTKMIKTAHRDLYRIITKEGYTHTVTKDHRVMTSNGWVEAQNLKKGDRLCINTQNLNPDGLDSPELAFLIGHYQGDGTQTETQIILEVWEKEYDLIPYIESCVKTVYDKYRFKTDRYDYPKFNKENGDSKRLSSMKLREIDFFVKNKIPDFIWESNETTILHYIKGLFYTDGTTFQNKKHESIKFTQINQNFVKEIQLLLLVLGIKCCVYETVRDFSFLPDGKGGQRLYPVQNTYTLEITNKKYVLYLEEKIGLFAHRNKNVRGFLNEKKSHPIIEARFESLEFLGRSDVYCISVHSDIKAWVCNGFITHNTEIAMSSDINDWKMNLTDNERNVIGQILKGFTQSEVFIQEYWSQMVSKWFKKPEIQMMSAAFASMESVHAVSYAYLNQSLGLEDFSAFLHEPTAKAKIDRLISTKGKSKEEIARSLAIFSAFNEGVNLFSSFAILLNFSRFNKMKGLGQIIAFSIKDESLHSEAGCWLFRTLISEFPEIWTDDLKKDIYQAARDTIDLEDNFIDKVFELGDVEGLTAKDIKTFIRYRCNTKLGDLGLKKNYKNIDKDGIERMAWFDVLSGGVSHSDFFASRVSDYSKGTIDFSKIWDQ